MLENTLQFFMVAEHWKTRCSSRVLWVLVLVQGPSSVQPSSAVQGEGFQAFTSLAVPSHSFTASGGFAPTCQICKAAWLECASVIGLHSSFLISVSRQHGCSGSAC